MENSLQPPPGLGSNGEYLSRKHYYKQTITPLEAYDTTAVLDLEKAYERVNRKTLIEVSRQWLHPDLLNMVREILSPLRVQTKSDPTNYTAVITRGVPQGGPSSPVLFNMYIGKLAVTAQATSSVRLGDRAILMLADDVLIQARTRETLQALLNVV